jgi:hypothetical protein
MTAIQQQVAAAIPQDHFSAAVVGSATVLERVIAAGRRDATPATTTTALHACWRQLASRTPRQRAEMFDALRAAIRDGETTARAWLPLALAEIDPALLSVAVAGYLGSAPCSVDRRARALDDVLQWFLRGLALDRVAVFAALLRLRDDVVNERLAAVRGRLTDAERARVLREFTDAEDAATREFCADWLAGA